MCLYMQITAVAPTCTMKLPNPATPCHSTDDV